MALPDGVSRDSIRAVVELLDGQGGSTGAVDATAYSDPTGAADGDMIALLKGMYVLLAQIEENTRPTP